MKADIDETIEARVAVAFADILPEDRNKPSNSKRRSRFGASCLDRQDLREPTEG